MVPVALAMIGTGLRPTSLLFMGWFGPRGLASVVFTLIAFESLHEGGLAPDALIEVATWTVLLSVIAHGVTAGPLASKYGRSVADEPVEQHEAGAHLGDPVPRALTEAASSTDQLA
jgi:sodium/hydrogen antiporter